MYLAAGAVIFDVFLAALAVAFLVLGSRQAATDQVPPRHALDAVAYALLLLAGAALLARRRAQVALFAVETVLCLLYFARGYPYGPVPIVVGLAAFGVGRHTGRLLATAVSAPAAAGRVAAFDRL